LFPFIVAREKLTRGESLRVPEPMVMDEPEGAAEYDAIGNTLQAGIHQFNALGTSRLLPEGGTVVDLGCGSGRLLVRLAKGRPDARIIGLDLSDPMLEMGRELMERERIADRVELRKGDITTFDSDVADSFDVVSCNFALHQLPSEDLAQSCLQAIARARSATGCGVWIFDFARLRNPKTWPAFASMVEWAGPVVYHDGLASERAAFTFEELRSMLERAGLQDVEHVLSKPLGDQQVHWAAKRGQPPVIGTWKGQATLQSAGLLGRMVSQSFPRELTRT
jgi:ubiquinone/menaquinone biosynthesis C-methylase UbiE